MSSSQKQSSNYSMLKNLIEWTTTSEKTIGYKQFFISFGVFSLEAASFALAWFYPIRYANSPKKFFTNAFTTLSIEVTKEVLYDKWQLSFLENTSKNVISAYKQVDTLPNNLKVNAVEEIHKLTQHVDLWSYQTIVTIKGSAILLGGLGFVAKNIIDKNYVSILWAAGLSATHFAYCQSIQERINEIKKTNREIIIKAKNNFDNPDQVRAEMQILNDKAFLANQEAAYLRFMPSIFESLYNSLFSLPRTTDHLNKALATVTKSENSISNFLPGKLEGHIYINKFVNWWFANYPRIGELLFRADDINSSLEKLKSYGIKIVSNAQDKNKIDKIEAEQKIKHEDIFFSPFEGAIDSISNFAANVPTVFNNIFYSNNKLDVKLVSGVSILSAAEISEFYLETLLRNTDNSLFYTFLILEKILLTSVKNNIYGNVNSYASYNMRDVAIDAYSHTNLKNSTENAANKNSLMQYFMNSDPLASQSLVVMQGLFTSISPIANSLYKLAAEKNPYILGYISLMLSANIFFSFGYSKYFFGAKYALTQAASEPFSQSLSIQDGVESLEENFDASYASYVNLRQIRIPLNVIDQIHRTLTNQGEAIRPLNEILLSNGFNLGLGENGDKVFMATKTFTLFTNFHLANYFRLVDWGTKASSCSETFNYLNDSFTSLNNSQVETLGVQYESRVEL